MPAMAMRLDLVEDGLHDWDLNWHWMVHGNSDVLLHGVRHMSLNGVWNAFLHWVWDHLLNWDGDLFDNGNGNGVAYRHMNGVGLGNGHQDGMGQSNLVWLQDWHMDLLVDVHGNVFGHLDVVADGLGMTLFVHDLMTRRLTSERASVV